MRHHNMEREPPGSPGFDRSTKKALLKKDKITPGDYVYGPEGVQGVFWKTGVIWDFDEGLTDLEDDEWSNISLRESTARSCIIRTRR